MVLASYLMPRRCLHSGAIVEAPHAVSCLRLRQRSSPMPPHPNVKLTPKGLETLVSRIESGSGIDMAARQMGVNCQAACPQQARRGFSDCDSRPCIHSTAAGTPTAGVRAPAPCACAWHRRLLPRRLRRASARRVERHMRRVHGSLAALHRALQLETSA